MEEKNKRPKRNKNSITKYSATTDDCTEKATLAKKKKKQQRAS